MSLRILEEERVVKLNFSHFLYLISKNDKSSISMGHDGGFRIVLSCSINVIKRCGTELKGRFITRFFAARLNTRRRDSDELSGTGKEEILSEEI